MRCRFNRHILSYDYTLLYGIINHGILNYITHSEKGRSFKLLFFRFTMNEKIKEMDFEDLLVDEIEMD